VITSLFISAFFPLTFSSIIFVGETLRDVGMSRNSIEYKSNKRENESKKYKEYSNTSHREADRKNISNVSFNINLLSEENE
jgi:hypothetical protein